MDRHLVLQRWMAEYERGPAWVAQKVGRTREYTSAVAHGHRPFSDKLAQALTEHLGIQFANDTNEQPARRNRKPKKSATT